MLTPTGLDEKTHEHCFGYNGGANGGSLQLDADMFLERYQLMDTGSKWGTFVQAQLSIQGVHQIPHRSCPKVPPEGDLLKCGDWLRIGNAELVVRFCGGHCNAHRRASASTFLRVASVSFLTWGCAGGMANAGNACQPWLVP